MRLSVKALAIASGLLWGGCLLAVGFVNLVTPHYGVEFLRGMGSVYPGFYTSRSLAQVLLGGGYGLVDGAIAGLVFGWLYNAFAEHKASVVQQPGEAPMGRAA